jgi:alpha-methylacyl-CoA racemase
MTARAPLDGVRVLDLSRLLPGPYGTLLLADLGAAVDKVEDPGAGDYLRSWPHVPGVPSGKFAALNRDKRSLVLDLKSDAGRSTLLRLLPRYDVLVESFRPGVMERLGLGWDVLHAANPRLVLCAISGYPADGPFRDRAAHDLNTVGLCGPLGLTGPPGDPPAVPGTQLADMTTGLFAATAIVAALFAAQRDGVGRRVEISMSASTLALCVPSLGDVAIAPLRARGTDHLTGGSACYGVYRTADDKLLTVAALEPKFWLLFCQTIGRDGTIPELFAPADEQARIRADVAGRLAQKTRAEWEAIFAGIDACCEPVLTPDELAAHPLHADAFVDVDGLRLPRTPLGRRTKHTRAPHQGEHTEQILSEGDALPPTT